MTRDPRYDVLFEPVKIGPVVAPNRFYQVPHCNGAGFLRPRVVAEMRGVKEGMLVSLSSRKGEIALVATITERVQPGVVYTTFHNPETGANVVTTEHSDWATDCPEYKVTAVQIAPAKHRTDWQHEFDANAKRQAEFLETAK